MPKKIQWTTEQRKINDLIPHPLNPRQMTEKQVADLVASLEKFNLAEIPVINTDGMLLAGHQRCKIMQLLERGDQTIDVRVPNRLLDEEEAKEYLIRSNKNTGGWDFDLLANGFDADVLMEWGFSEFELGTDANLDDFFEDPPPAEDPEELHRIVLDFTEADYGKVVAALDALDGSREQAVWRLLGLSS